MKKILFSLMLATSALSMVTSAYADDHDHHRTCHKVKVHQHWVNRCH
jgi:hypothetical protein